MIPNAFHRLFCLVEERLRSKLLFVRKKKRRNAQDGITYDEDPHEILYKDKNDGVIENLEDKCFL